MVASISGLFQCPRCEKDMSSAERPKKCPNCQYSFRDPDEILLDHYEWPKNFYDMLYELCQLDMEKLMDKPVSEIIHSIPKELAKDMIISNKNRAKLIKGKRQFELHEFIINSNVEELEDYLKVTLHIFQLMHYSHKKGLMIMATSYGKKIGACAEVLQKLLESGAQFYDRSNKITKPRDREQRDANVGGKESLSSTGSRRENSSSDEQLVKE